MKIAGRLSLLVVVLILAGCAQAPPPEPPDTRAADEAAIRAAAKDWSASAQAKDPVKFASFYQDDAILMLEDSPDFTGRSTISETLTGMMQDPNFALSFETTKVEVARSGDIAYELSTYSITMSDPKTKKPVAEKGSGIVVWRKQADGMWKVAVDVPVSDPPEAPAK